MTGERAAGAELTLGRVAELCGGRLEGGDPDQAVDGVASLVRAGPRQVALLASDGYLAEARETEAGALLVSESLAGRAPEGRPRVVVEDAHAALIPLLEALHPVPDPEPGVHPTAVLGKGVRLGEDVTVGPYAVLEEGAVLGRRVRVGAHSVVGRGVQVGDDTVLHPHVVLYPGTVLGARVILHAGVRLGVDGFGYAWVEGGHRKVPQVGRCMVEDDVEIGANTTVDRGSIGDTVVGRGTKLDNLVHLAHNVTMGSHCAVAAMVGVAGSVRVGTGVLLAGQAGVAGHLEIGDGARVGAAARVWKDVPPGETYLGDPARPKREYLRSRAEVARLSALVDRVRELEAGLEALGGGVPGAEEPGGAGDAAGGSAG